MHERILIPLDGSEVGEAALPYVEDLIAKLKPQVKVEITLLQVISPATPVIIGGFEAAPIPYEPMELSEIEARATEYLGRTGKALQEKGVGVTTVVAVGKASDEIKRAAEAIDADLIAMSTHGRTGITRWAFGSVTDRVLRSRTRPVLLVRTPKGDFGHGLGATLSNIVSGAED